MCWMVHALDMLNYLLRYIVSWRLTVWCIRRHTCYVISPLCHFVTHYVYIWALGWQIDDGLSPFPGPPLPSASALCTSLQVQLIMLSGPFMGLLVIFSSLKTQVMRLVEDYVSTCITTYYIYGGCTKGLWLHWFLCLVVSACSAMAAWSCAGDTGCMVFSWRT